MDKDRIGTIELSIQSVTDTANYFELMFTHLGFPDLGSEKYIEMASHAILAHEMMHANLEAMENAIRRQKLTDFLTQHSSREDILAIKTRIEVVSWVMEEMGQDGFEAVKNHDYDKIREIKAKVRNNFSSRFGDTSKDEGVEQFRDLMTNHYFDLYNFINIVNYRDAKVDFIFDPVAEDIFNLPEVNKQYEEYDQVGTTDVLKGMANTAIQEWYTQIWNEGTIPEDAKTIVQKLPDKHREYAPGYMLGEQLPSTIERVVFTELLRGVLETGQADKLFTGMDEESFKPILRMYPILLDLLKRNGLSIEQYMDMQTRAKEDSDNIYTCTRRKKYSGRVEEMYNNSLMNPVLLLGYLVRLEPQILTQVKL